MTDGINQTLVLGVIALLLIWLIYRIKRSVKRLIEKEIFKNFPAVKDTFDNYQRRLEYLKIEIELLEKKIRGLKLQTK
ncbi:MAG: hypothetical protein V1923_06035 [Candidatus Omnitrophota bacterium]